MRSLGRRKAFSPGHLNVNEFIISLFCVWWKGRWMAMGISGNRLLKRGDVGGIHFHGSQLSSLPLAKSNNKLRSLEGGSRPAIGL